MAKMTKTEAKKRLEEAAAKVRRVWGQSLSWMPDSLSSKLLNINSMLLSARDRVK